MREEFLGKWGEDTMHEAKSTLKQRVFHGMRRGLVIASYLFIVLSLLDMHKSVILAEHQIDLVEFGLNFINALALAKVMLVGQELNFARRSSIKRYGSHSRTQFYLHASKSLKWPLSACYTTGHLLKAWLASLEVLDRITVSNGFAVCGVEHEQSALAFR